MPDQGVGLAGAAAAGLRGLAGRRTPQIRWSGTHRTVPPSETLDRIRPLLSLAGITRVANVTGLDRAGVPVVMVCRPNSRSLAVFQGKGLTLDAAKASGIMEAIERFHAEYPVLPLRSASAAAMAVRGRVLDPADLPRAGPMSPAPGATMAWVEGWDLIRGDRCWIPLEAVALGYAGPAGLRTMSSGLAAGNDLAEACVHALCEVVERDATTLWRLLPPAERTRRRIDPATIRDADCLQVLDAAARAGLAAAIWETTSEIRVPAFQALLLERDDVHWTPLVKAEGAGCHPSRSVALLRALTEAFQARLTLISGARDDLFRRFYRPPPPERVSAWRREILDGDCPAAFDSADGFAGRFFEQDLAAILSRLDAAGFDRVLAVDLTREDFGIPVVRIIVPGMQDGDLIPGYAPDRRTRIRLAAA